MSKKFCKDLKTSLWYGVKDLVSGITGSQANRELRDKEFWAVKDISFELRRGECLGLIGHNGAGKSTLLKILNGLINPDEGSVTMRGRVGALIELGAGFNPILTGRENIYNNGAVLGFTRKEIDAKVEEIIDFSEIREFIDMPVQNYSSGMKVRLGFSVAVQMEPDVLIIDEVLAVGDVGFRYKCLNAIGKLMKSAAVIFVTHSMPQIYRICSDIMLMNRGESIIQSKDLGKGIDKYFEMSNDGEEQIAGTGEATLKEIILMSGDKFSIANEILKINHGDDLLVKLKIKLESHLEKARVKLIVWNQDLIPVLDVLDTELRSFPVQNNPEGLIELSVLIPGLSLNNGKHYISVLIDSFDLSRHYCKYDKAGILNISIARPNGALLLVPAIWEV